MPRGPHCRAYYSNCAVISHFTCQTAYVTGLDGMSYCNQTLLLPEAGVWAWDYVWVCLLLLVGHVMCEWGEMCEWDNCFMLSPSPHRRWCRCKQWNAGGGGAWELVLSPDPTEILGYFNTMTQHFFGALSVLNYAYSKLWIFNKAQGISRMSPDPLHVGGVWGRDYWEQARWD